MACTDVEAGEVPAGKEVPTGQGDDKPPAVQWVILETIYEYINIPILLVLGFPWVPFERFFIENETIGPLVVSFGFFINGAVAFGVSTYLAASYEVAGLSKGNEIQAQAANVAPFCFMLGWFWGMSGLALGELYHRKFQENEDYAASFSRVILAKYGYKIKKDIKNLPQYNFSHWSTACVIGAIFSEAAKYIGTPKTVLQCSNNPMSMQACADLVNNATVIMDSRGNCCQVLDQRFDLGTFLSEVGGILIASAALASMIASKGIQAYGIGTPIEKGD